MCQIISGVDYFMCIPEIIDELDRALRDGLRPPNLWISKFVFESLIGHLG
jgi:hypothetical protein